MRFASFQAGPYDVFGDLATDVHANPIRSRAEPVFSPVADNADAAQGGGCCCRRLRRWSDCQLW